MSRPRAMLIAITIAALDVGAVIAWWRVREARRAILAAVLDVEPRPLLYFTYTYLEAQARTLAITGAALTLIAIVATLAGLAWTRRGSLPRSATIASSIMIGLTGTGLLLGARAFFSYNEGCGDPAIMEPLRYEAFSAQGMPYEGARLAILVALVLSTALILRRARHASSLPAPVIVAPLALFAIGLGAFVVTRAEAHDAHHPMPLQPAENMRIWAHLTPPPPPALGCRPGVGNAPMVTHDPRGFLLNGVLGSGEAELTRQLMATRELWRQVTPNKPFPGEVEVALPASMPIEDTKPLFAAVRAAGYSTIDVIEALPADRWSTRTLGEVAYASRACRLRIPDPERLPPARTWGEMARALAP